MIKNFTDQASEFVFVNRRGDMLSGETWLHGYRKRFDKVFDMLIDSAEIQELTKFKYSAFKKSLIDSIFSLTDFGWITIKWADDLECFTDWALSAIEETAPESYYWYLWDELRDDEDMRFTMYDVFARCIAELKLPKADFDLLLANINAYELYNQARFYDLMEPIYAMPGGQYRVNILLKSNITLFTKVDHVSFYDLLTGQKGLYLGLVAKPSLTFLNEPIIFDRSGIEKFVLEGSPDFDDHGLRDEAWLKSALQILPTVICA